MQLAVWEFLSLGLVFMNMISLEQCRKTDRTQESLDSIVYVAFAQLTSIGVFEFYLFLVSLLGLDASQYSVEILHIPTMRFSGPFVILGGF